jgi:RNA polymerase sigma-70 factor, ECF subfamily
VSTAIAETAGIDDAQWIDQTLDGNEAAFGHLVRKYQQRLHKALARSIGRHEEIEDVVQEAFLQAFVNLETFRRSSTFYTWLYRIAFNLTCRFRRLRRPAVLDGKVRRSSRDELVDPAPDPVRRFDQNERCRQVHEAIATLDADHRRVLILRDIEGLCYAKIAETLDLPAGTVRSRLHRARLQLVKKIKAEMN